MKKPTHKIIYIVLIALGVAAFIILIARASYVTSFSSLNAPVSLVSVNIPQTANDQTETDTITTDSPTPRVSSSGGEQPSVARLSIPVIKVDAAIESVGLDSRGNMDTPARLADVGWYDKGTAIGSVGSAVIDGHVDNSFSLPAVFYDLKKVQKGDDIFVTTSTGTRLHFMVTEIHDYALATAPVSDIFNDRSGERLIQLITCDGTWDSNHYSYDHRVVVTAKLVPN